MPSTINKVLVLGFSLLFSLSVAAAKKEAPSYSGYLAEDIYPKLEEIEIHKGVTAKRWIGPRLNFSNFKSVLIEDVILYPEPEPGPQVSAETLEAIRSYATEKLTAKVGSVLKLADEPGPQVLRVQAAITGVEIKTEGMKTYEIVPVAAIFGGLKALTGKRDREVHVFIEVSFSDSETGEVVGAAVRSVEGEHLKGKKDQLGLEDMQESLDSATDDAQKVLAGILAEE